MGCEGAIHSLVIQPSWLVGVVPKLVVPPGGARLYGPVAQWGHEGPSPVGGKDPTGLPPASPRFGARSLLVDVVPFVVP